MITVKGGAPQPRGEQGGLAALGHNPARCPRGAPGCACRVQGGTAGGPGAMGGVADMAGQLISMTLEDGGDETAVVFEVDGALAESDLDLAAGDGLVGRARISVQDALDQVKPTLARVARTVRELGPDEAEIEFGLKMGGETGVIVAKGTAEVNFAVRLVWHRA